MTHIILVISYDAIFENFKNFLELVSELQKPVKINLSLKWLKSRMKDLYIGGMGLV